jgi:hypothetical protein
MVDVGNDAKIPYPGNRGHAAMTSTSWQKNFHCKVDMALRTNFGGGNIFPVDIQCQSYPNAFWEFHLGKV